MKSQDPSLTEATGTPEEEATPTEIVTVRPTREVMSKQRLPYFFGVSEETSGARGLSMSLVVIPPGASAEPHYHRGFETAIYILEGCVRDPLRQRATPEGHPPPGGLSLHSARRAAPAGQPQRPGAGPGYRGPQPSQRQRGGGLLRSGFGGSVVRGGVPGNRYFFEHGCTGLTAREVPTPEADSGDDPLRACGCPGLQASRFLKKSCASCASM